MLGVLRKAAPVQLKVMGCIAAQGPIFSLGRLKDSGPRLGVEVQSTGEVARFGVNQYEAFLEPMVLGGS